jgi:hypothetical protein
MDAASSPASPALFPWAARLPLIPVFTGTCVVVITVLVVMMLARTGGRQLLPLCTRVRLRMWPGPGFIRSRLALRRGYGLPAARRIARRGRPSLSRRDRRFGPWQQYAGYVGRAHGWLWATRVFTHFEQLRLVIAPPQKGKSAAAAGSIIDDPGPVVATSIRGDLIAASAGLRQQVGTVHVLNPEGAGNFGSTLTWNPVAGCEDMPTAARRAGYMVEGVTARGLDDASFWQDQASMTLAAYLHAAGLAAGSMRDVYRWILDEDEQPLHILASHPGAAEFALGMVRRYMDLPDRTRAGISTTLNAALRFMQDPNCAEILCPPGPGTLDIPAFLASRDTLYLVVADAAQSPVPPVFTMLVAEIVHTARVIGGARRRLDPPLTLELDEIGNTAPVPVAAWATWAAGTGIRIHLYLQSYSQLAQRWKDHGAETIWQSCDVKVIYGHTTEDPLCRRVEAACGVVRPRPGRGPAGPGAAEPVLPAAVVRELPAGHAVVIQGGAKPVIIRPEQYWRRKDVRRFERHGGTAALPAAPHRAVPAPDPSLLAAAEPGLLDPGLLAAAEPGLLDPGLLAAEPLPAAVMDCQWPVADELAGRRAQRTAAAAAAAARHPQMPSPYGAWPGGYPGWAGEPAQDTWPLPGWPGPDEGD